MGYWREETKDETTEYQGQPLTVTIRKFNAGHEADMIKQCSQMKIMSGIQRGEMDVGMAKLLAIKMGIVKAPFPHKTLEEVKQIPKEIADWIYERISEYNDVKEKLGDLLLLWEQRHAQLEDTKKKLGA